MLKIELLFCVKNMKILFNVQCASCVVLEIKINYRSSQLSKQFNAWDLVFKTSFSWTGRRSVSSSPSPSAEDWTLLDQPSRQRSSGDLSPPIRSGKIVTAFNKFKVGVRRSKQIDEPVCQPGVCFKCKQVNLKLFYW